MRNNKVILGILTTVFCISHFFWITEVSSKTMSTDALFYQSSRLLMKETDKRPVKLI